ncbi:hypothetical protein MHEC_46070 [Mycobacterium heckeshornense]|uniref:D-amino-acid oxidase n=1 Tax=Mycobacterium heckeshornense TaxID=110505 RepID=A0A7R7GZ20_9MYCO|nr:hypothetical protein MHEC_46070 [Mycobacterium heckeshornense]
MVVGAGVSGLTTAICLAEAGSPVRVWAAEPPAQTTSIVAGALWGPAFQEPASQTLAWMAQSLRDFQELARVAGTGVRLAPVLAVGELANVDELPPQADLVPGLRRCAPSQLPPGFTHGFRATMPLIDMPRYLEYLLNRLSAAGGEIEIRPVESLTEAAEVAPIVVNCTGLGARELVGDDTLQPMFGQHVVLSNPGLDQVFVEVTEAEEWTCFFSASPAGGLRWHPGAGPLGPHTRPGCDRADSAAMPDDRAASCRRRGPRDRHRPAPRPPRGAARGRAPGPGTLRA